LSMIFRIPILANFALKFSNRRIFHSATPLFC